MRFVVLTHSDSRGVHWDLMFEEAGALRAWSLAVEPRLGRSCDARQLTDHRKEYLDYEGPVSGDRGTVTAFDRGEYMLLESTPTLWRAAIQGARLAGLVVFSREREDEEPWQFRLQAVSAVDA